MQRRAEEKSELILISAYFYSYNMIRVGEYNELKVLRTTGIGVYLDDGGQGILLPKRYVPEGLKDGDTLNVFLYHDKRSNAITCFKQTILSITFEKYP